MNLSEQAPAQTTAALLEQLAALIEAPTPEFTSEPAVGAQANRRRFTVDDPKNKTSKHPALNFEVDPKEVAALNAKADAMQEKLNAFFDIVDSNAFKRKFVQAGNTFSDSIGAISTALTSRKGAPLKDTKSRVDGSFKTFHAAFTQLEAAYKALQKSHDEVSEKLHEIGYV